MNKYLSYLLVLTLIIAFLIIFLVFFIIQQESTLHQFMYPQLYRNKFKDSYFPPLTNQKEYWSRVRKGYKIMERSKLAVIGLAYNLGEEKTHKLIRRMKYLTEHFGDYRIIIYYIDSEDDTYYILDNSDLKIEIPLKRIDKRGLTRVQKMSKLRNICKRRLEKIDFDPDYVIIQDCDLASAMSLDGIANSLSYMNEYDALFANGLNNNFIFNWHIPYLSFTYYDTFAYKSEGGGMDGDKAVTFGRGYSPFRVKSAFGGAGIYKYEVLKKFKYDEKHPSMCEHVNLHFQMHKKGYKLGINPSFLLFSGMQGESTHKKCRGLKCNDNAYRSVYDLSDDSYRIF